MKSNYTTKATYLGKGYGCRVFRGGVVVVEGIAKDKSEIGPVFRDLLRTIDKMCNGDKFTAAARGRKWKVGNKSMATKHYWGGVR